MEDKYLQHEGCTSEPQQETIRVLIEDQSITMHCGYLFYLFVALWVELAVGMSIIKPNIDGQSIIEDLKRELDKYETVLNKTNTMREAPACSKTAAHLNQLSMVVNRLIEYQKCAEKTQSFVEDKDNIFKDVTNLNEELLKHLGLPTTTTSSHTSSSRLPFNIAQESMRCFRCWKQQVAALSR